MTAIITRDVRDKLLILAGKYSEDDATGVSPDDWGSVDFILDVVDGSVQITDSHLNWILNGCKI